MEVILIHGMGRSRLSFLLLAGRLRAAGHRVRYVDHCAAVDSLERATRRLLAQVAARPPGTRYALIGHSLGAVIIRHAYARLRHDPPAACGFLAAPMRACRAAAYFSRFRLFRLCTGEMGRLLGDPRFMDALPMPPRTRVVAADGGPRRRWLPFGEAPNDGVLLLSEASPDDPAALRVVPGVHTLIMHSPGVAADLLAWLAEAEAEAEAEAGAESGAVASTHG